MRVLFSGATFEPSYLNSVLIAVLYGQKSFLQVYLYALEVVSNADAGHPRWSTSGVSSFRSFGDVSYSNCRSAKSDH